jgi:Na+/H+ antiporter NhaD/arsenite permease-like protein
MAPVTILITQVLELPTAMFLILEALASNIGGTATLIGDPPNIILGSKVGLTFWDFFVHLTPTVILIGAAFVLTAWLVLRKRLRVPPQVQARVLKACPELAIIKPHMMRRSLLVFLFIFGLFFTHHLYHLPVGIVAIGGLGVMMLICRVNVDEMLKMVEWDAVLFFVGLFIVVGTMEHQGVLERAAELLVSVCGQNQLLAMLVILWGRALFSAVLDNIPFVIVMTPLVQNLVVDMGGAPDAPHPLYWALALGACLGGNATLIGASANVVVSKIGARNGYAITFMGFTRWGVLFTLESLVLATLCLWVRYYSGW